MKGECVNYIGGIALFAVFGAIVGGHITFGETV